MFDAPSWRLGVARIATPVVCFSRKLFRHGSLLLGVVLIALGSQAARAEVQVINSTSTAAGVAASADAGVTQQMATLQHYIVDTYRVPLQSMQTVVDSAWQVGEAMGLDPLLLLAVMAIESSFNVKAESHMGAQGLMQVMTKIHRKRFEPHGGSKAVFQPEVNIKVGAQILQECIDRRGSVLGGLTCYVGAAGTTSGYGKKVLAKLETLRRVTKDSADTVLVASADSAHDPTFDDHVIEAPPISRFVEADAPRLARNLLNELDAVDL